LEASNGNSTVHRLSVEEVAPRVRAANPSPPSPLLDQTIPAQPTMVTPQTTGPTTLELMLRVLVEALSARAILLLSLIGAFVLAYRAMSLQTVASLEVLGLYGGFAILPIAYLEIRRRQ
jgi:hypothetical protein